jgi:hypothetical protein
MGTGYIAIVNGNGNATNWSIYGNVFYWTGNYTDGIINTGVIMNRYDGGGPINVQAINWQIYNNIIANIRGGSFTARIAPEGPLGVYTVKNNIWYNNVAVSGAGGVDVDYGSNSVSGPNDIIGTASPFADATPWLTGNWALSAPLAGLALSAPYNLDWSGQIRGLDGTWDRGALEFNGS